MGLEQLQGPPTSGQGSHGSLHGAAHRTHHTKVLPCESSGGSHSYCLSVDVVQAVREAPDRQLRTGLSGSDITDPRQHLSPPGPDWYQHRGGDQ